MISLATTSHPKSFSISLESSAQYGTRTALCLLAESSRAPCLVVAIEADQCNSQIRQGIANNTKGTAFVVYEDVMDAKQACDKLNGFNFQNRYLVGTSRNHNG